MLLCSSPFGHKMETVPRPVYPEGIRLIDDRISNLLEWIYEYNRRNDKMFVNLETWDKDNFLVSSCKNKEFYKNNNEI